MEIWIKLFENKLYEYPGNTYRSSFDRQDSATNFRIKTEF